MSIMHEIIERRQRRISVEGHSLGVHVPESRRVPVVPFGRSPFVICEIKRRSPSKGAISASLDAVAQASLYASRGIRTVSVLTEEDHFSGSLEDLIRVKESNPDLCVLRKDFLTDVEDIELSYRAGADCVLLIASALDRERFELLFRTAGRLGIACLVEVHSAEEVAMVAGARPAFTGINARDLSTFSVDPLLPLSVRRFIDWDTQTVFESGIQSREHARFAAASGFSGILVGESVVRDPSLAAELAEGLEEGKRSAQERGAAPFFWSELAARRRGGRPLVKVCGLTSPEDAHLAERLGADVLGFILAPSKRRVDESAVAEVGATGALKVGVVVLGQGASALPDEAARLLETGALDALQFHGDEQPSECSRLAFPYYKALQLRGSDDAGQVSGFRCPRVLVDAYSKDARGGTGRSLDASTIAAVQERTPLWLAGGIGPDNVFEIITGFSPELIDASSALEASPGRKDPEKLNRFFAEIERAVAAVTERA